LEGGSVEEMALLVQVIVGHLAHYTHRVSLGISHIVMEGKHAFSGRQKRDFYLTQPVPHMTLTLHRGAVATPRAFEVESKVCSWKVKGYRYLKDGCVIFVDESRMK